MISAAHTHLYIARAKFAPTTWAPAMACGKNLLLKDRFTYIGSPTRITVPSPPPSQPSPLHPYLSRLLINTQPRLRRHDTLSTPHHLPKWFTPPTRTRTSLTYDLKQETSHSQNVVLTGRLIRSVHESPTRSPGYRSRTSPRSADAHQHRSQNDPATWVAAPFSQPDLSSQFLIPTAPPTPRTQQLPPPPAETMWLTYKFCIS